MSENQSDTLQQQDENVVETTQGSGNASNWLQGNLMYIVGGVIAIVLVIFGIKWYSSNMEEKEQVASLALSRVKTYYDAGEWQKALDGDPNKKVRNETIIGLKSIVDEYESTSAGKSAALYAGNAFVMLKKMDEAEKYFEIASKADSKIVVVGAKSGLAGCLESKKNYKEAADIYEKLLEMADEVGGKDRYELYAGLCYEKLGDKVNSEKMYRNLLAEFENSEYAGEAKSGLVRLGMVVE